MRSLLLLALAGCATAPVVMHAPAGYDEKPAWQVVEDIGIPADLERVDTYEPGDPDYHSGEPGVIHVWITKRNLPNEAGHAHLSVCSPVIELERKTVDQALAHEVGHTLLLQALAKLVEHHQDDAKHNVLSRNAGGTEITNEQRALMRVGAQRLRLCKRARQ